MTTPTCVCARHGDGSVTTSLCSQHAEQDPCLTMARVTGKRRRGSIIKGVCSSCGWSAARIDGDVRTGKTVADAVGEPHPFDPEFCGTDCLPIESETA